MGAITALPKRKPRERFSSKGQINYAITSNMVVANGKSNRGAYQSLALPEVIEIIMDAITKLTQESEDTRSDIEQAGIGNPVAQDKIKALIDTLLVSKRILILEESLIDGMGPVDSVFSMTVGAGLIEDLYKLTDVEEIQVNGTEIYVVRSGLAQLHTRRFKDISEVENLQDRLALCGKSSINEQNAFCHTYMFNGSRLVMTRDRYSSYPTINIRNFTVKDVSLDALIGFGTLTDKMAEFIRLLVLYHASFAIVGGTFSGKTTTLFSLIREIPEKERVITLEKEFEIQIKKRLKGKRNIVELREDSNSGLDMEEAFKPILLMTPNWIVVGEAKGSEVKQAIQGSLRGHDVMFTMHSKYTDMFISDVIEMVQQDGRTYDEDNLKKRIARAFNIVLIQKIVRDSNGNARRVIAEITELYIDENDEIQIKPFVKWNPLKADWEWTGHTVSPMLVEHMLNNGANLSKLARLGVYSE